MPEQIQIQMQYNQEIIFNKNSLNTLDKPQNISCSSMISPEFNLDRKRLQSFKTTSNTKSLFISPSWWDDLTDEDKDYLQCLIEYIEDNDQGRILNIKDHPEALNYSSHIFL